jgi:hypothetical protein
MKIGVRARFAAVLLAAWMLAGCHSITRTTVNANDDVVMPEVRLSLLSGGGGRPSDFRSGTRIELAATRAQGGDSQQHLAGDPALVHSGQRFNAPDQLEHRFDYRFYSAAARWRQYHPERGWWGALFGLGLMKELRPGTSLQARVSQYGAKQLGIDKAVRIELAAVQTLGAYVAARVGYARWRLYSDNRRSDSDLRMALDALTLGLDFHF